MKQEKVSVSEYAAMRGITRAAVKKQIQRNRPMPGVISFEKIGNYYALTIDPSQIQKL